MIEIRFATSQDYAYLVHKDHHAQPEVITKKVEDAEIIVVLDNEQNNRMVTLQLLLGSDSFYEYVVT